MHSINYVLRLGENVGVSLLFCKFIGRPGAMSLGRFG